MKPLAERDEFWPYTKTEAAKIRNYFNPPSRRALNIAVNAASDFVDLYDPEQKKPNVRLQVQRLGAAVEQMQRALSDVSAGAEGHLMRQRQTSPVNDPIELDRLRMILHQFAFENRPGFLNLPEKTKAGPKEKRLEKSLMVHFEKAFIAGHGGVRPKDGFPDFRGLCRDPLVKMNLLHNLDTKSLQDKTRRNNRPKNRGN